MSRKKLVLTAIVLVLVLAIGGILAYFTDVQTRHNKFKTGMVDVEVDEPSWPGQPIDNPNYDPTDPNSPEKIDPEVPVVPGQEIPKDPQVVNKGDGKVYAFVEVTVPVRNVKVGNATNAAPTPLFTLRHITDSTTNPVTVADGYNTTDWALIKQEPETITSETTSVKYVFAYGTSSALKAIDGKTVSGNTTTYARTAPVFDKVKFVDVTETEYSSNSQIQNQSFEVEVKGYGIQIDGLSSTTPLTVWTNDVKK